MPCKFNCNCRFIRVKLNEYEKMSEKGIQTDSWRMQLRKYSKVMTHSSVSFKQTQELRVN